MSAEIHQVHGPGAVFVAQFESFPCQGLVNAEEDLIGVAIERPPWKEVLPIQSLGPHNQRLVLGVELIFVSCFSCNWLMPENIQMRVLNVEVTSHSPEEFFPRQNPGTVEDSRRGLARGHDDDSLRSHG